MVQHGGSGQAAASRFIRTYLLTMDEVEVGLKTVSEKQKQNRNPPIKRRDTHHSRTCGSAW